MIKKMSNARILQYLNNLRDRGGRMFDCGDDRGLERLLVRVDEVIAELDRRDVRWWEM